MTNVKFVLDRAGGADILKHNAALKSMQEGAMEQTLLNIEAQFFQTFGVEGKFALVDFMTDRYSVKITAADKRTSAILKANPKWLDQFTNTIKI